MLFVLGILDILAGLCLFLLKFGIFEWVGYIFAGYLFLKGIVFFSPASLIDFISGVLIILAIFGYFSFFSYVAILWLIQKGVFSLFA